ncbi:MAG TPA: hypothetical protein VN902_21170 [Candidatus Acidoferrales bacterium]|nr:hypothetical protein [Candidatus Acidoferrales bacterium]
MNGEKQSARQPQESASPMSGNIDHARRVAPIDDLVSEIFQGKHRRTFGKIMKMRVLLTVTNHGCLAKKLLHRNVQGNMNQFVGALRLESPQKAAIVVNVSQYVNRHHQIERIPAPWLIVEQREMQSFIRSSLAQVDRLGRNISPPQLASRIQALLQQPENLAGAATDLIDCSGSDLIAIQNPQNLLHLPLRVGHMPAGILPQIGSIKVISWAWHEVPIPN